MKTVVFCVMMFLVCSTLACAAEPSLMAHIERAVGRSAKEQLTAAYGGEFQVRLHDHLRLQTIFERVSEAVDDLDHDYSLTVLNSNDANAFSLPGGFIFVSRGLLKLIGSDEQRIAGVLAHEMAHVKQKHGINALMRQLGLSVIVELGKAVLEMPKNAAVYIASQALIEVVQSGYSREAELEADQRALRYLVEAGFDPAGLVHVLSDLIVFEGEHPSGDVYRSHPYINTRIEQILSSLGSFWSEPKLINECELVLPAVSADPLGRFQINGQSLFDRQNNSYVSWFESISVSELAFAPDGSLIAAAVCDQEIWDIWLWNRHGVVVERWKLDSPVPIQNLVFSPDSRKIAYNLVRPEGIELWVGYVGEITRYALENSLGGEVISWQASGIILKAEADKYYQLVPPHVEAVETEDPIPLVIERKPRVNPEIEQGQDDSIRLTRPSSIEL